MKEKKNYSWHCQIKMTQSVSWQNTDPKQNRVSKTENKNNAFYENAC